MTELLLNVTSIDTAANIWVAIGTISMAIVTAIMVGLTFFSLRSTNKQLEIKRKQFTFQEITFKKDQILDQMELVIKPLRAELTFEIDKIKSSPVNFREYNKYGSLIFPIPNSKTFFVPNKKPDKMVGKEIPFHYTIMDIQKLHSELIDILKNRDYIYLQIASKITNIEEVLESDASNEQLKYLVKKYCNSRKELIYPDYDYYEEVIEVHAYVDEMIDGEIVSVPYDENQYDVSTFIKKIIKLLFDEIWGIDRKNVDPIEEEIIWMSSKVRAEFIETKKDSEIWSLKEEVNDLLIDLQNVDSSLMILIDSIISEYKEKYHLSAEQLASADI